MKRSSEIMDRQSILIVDDMPTNIAVLAEAFSQEYDVLVATTGERALELAFRSPPPDLILMDIIMPGLNGFDVCRRLKNNESTKNVPLIFITAKSDPEDEALGLSIGAADYVTKPFPPSHRKIPGENPSQSKKKERHAGDSGLSRRVDRSSQSALI